MRTLRGVRTVFACKPWKAREYRALGHSVDGKNCSLVEQIVTSLTMDSKILLVEDNDDDANLIQIAFRKYPILSGGRIRHERDGRQALNYLLERVANESLPLLIISDLKMPCFDGFDLLEAIRIHPRLKNIPFVIFTNSNHNRDREKAKTLGADLYIVKPPRLDEMASVAKALDELLRERSDPDVRRRIYVQSLNSGQFFCGMGHWTSVLSHALDFESLQRALWFCSANKIHRVRILVA